ncbi:MAG: BatA domain-containing protein [Bacteroidales bacterium]|nr:BatA domain-containing protein [Bacteroidales bacterium]
MSFLYPYILWGLLAVSIPVIIHLFNFRKFRKVYFTNVRFLEELKQQTRKQSKLRHLLVMISRMLAIASLVLAFSQPYIPFDDSSSRPDAISQVSIYLDNSFSMDALSANGPLLEAAKARAREIASAYRSTDLFMLTTNGFEGRHQRWVNRDEFLQLLDDITTTPVTRTISEVIARQADSYYSSSDRARTSYLISDFQQTMADLDRVNADSLMAVRLVPLQAVRNENLYIDSCWFISPVHQLNQGVKLMARVVNGSDTYFEKVPLKLTVNGVQKALAGFDIQPGAYHDVELPFTNYEEGIQSATVEITDYPVVFDDKMYLVYHVAGSIPVLAINGTEESVYLNSLFGLDSAFRFVNNAYKNIDYNRLHEYELVILNELNEISSGLMQELSVYVENGGTILIIPSVSGDLESFRSFLSSIGSNYFTEFVQESSRVAELDRENPVFADVFEKKSDAARELDNTDLPTVSSFYKISRQSRSSQAEIMSMLNGKPFLTLEQTGKGQVFLLAVPLAGEYSNFARHALFVPALYRIALLSAATDPLYYIIGKDRRIELNNTNQTGDHVLKIVSATEEFEFIPGQQNLNKKLNLLVYDQVGKAGHYKLMENDEVLKGLGFNYDRKESVMKFAGKEELEELIRRYSIRNMQIMTDHGKPLSEAIKDMNQGTSLWKLFIILALVFLAMEIVLLRFWKPVK